MTRKRGQNDLQVTHNRNDDYDKAQITGNKMDYHRDRHAEHGGAKYDDDLKEEGDAYAEFDSLVEQLRNRDIISTLRQQNAFAYDTLMLGTNTASSVEEVTSQAATSTARSATTSRGRSTRRTSISTPTDEEYARRHRCKVGSCWTDCCKFKI